MHRVLPQQLDELHDVVVVELGVGPVEPGRDAAHGGHRCAVVLELALQVGPFLLGPLGITGRSQVGIDEVRERTWCSRHPWIMIMRRSVISSTA